MTCDLPTLKAIYKDEEVAKAVLESAKEFGTVKQIESGELFLPSPHDARVYMERRKAEKDKAKANLPP